MTKKKLSSKLISFNEKKIRKIQMILKVKAKEYFTDFFAKMN
jgi:hypothetical protein